MKRHPHSVGMSIVEIANSEMRYFVVSSSVRTKLYPYCVIDIVSHKDEQKTNNIYFKGNVVPVVIV